MNLFLASSISTVASDIFPKAKTLSKHKKLIFIPTAGEAEGDPEEWLQDNRRELAKEAGFDVSIFTLTGKSPAEVAKTFQDVGAICVNGGNTYYLLHQARLSGFDKIIKKLVMDGTVYIGSSAGALVAGPNMETLLDPKVVPNMKNFTAFGLTDLSVRPHWGSPDFGPLYGKEMKFLAKSHPTQKILPITDTQYVHVKDDWYQVVDVTS